MTVESTERFLATFQCIEAICSLVKGTPGRVEVGAIAELASIVTREESGATAEALGLLARFVTWANDAPLRERFRHLAETKGGVAHTDDIARFKQVNFLGIELVRDRFSDIPHELNGVRLHLAVHELAVKYLRLLVEGIAVRHPTIVTGE